MLVVIAILCVCVTFILASAVTPPPYWKKGPRANSLLTKEGLVVTVSQGQISQEQVDVIVNTTSKDLNLNGGGVSSSILRAAGVSIQQEAHQVSPGGIPRGQLVITSGGNLTCSNIYHGSMPNWKGSASEKVLPSYVQPFATKCRISYSTLVLSFVVIVSMFVSTFLRFCFTVAPAAVCCAVPDYRQSGWYDVNRATCCGHRQPRLPT